MTERYSPHEWMVPPTAPPLQGEERFNGIDATVRDFWAFAMSDLRMNNVRGYLAEFLVARAVGATAPRVEWDAYDLVTPSGVTIEVKSCGYLQSWPQRAVSRISFTGQRGRTWSPDGGESESATYNADVYVFAIQTAKRHETYARLDVGQWEFHVVPRGLIEELGQSSIGLATLEKLSDGPTLYGELSRTVEIAGTGNRGSR